MCALLIVIWKIPLSSPGFYPWAWLDKKFFSGLLPPLFFGFGLSNVHDHINNMVIVIMTKWQLCLRYPPMSNRPLCLLPLFVNLTQSVAFASVEDSLILLLPCNCTATTLSFYRIIPMSPSLGKVGKAHQC